MDKREHRRRQNSAIDIGNMVFGKVPPQSREIEQAILGAMMLEYKSIVDVKEVLKPEHFYVEAHQRICRAIFDLHEHGFVDMLLVKEQLQKTEDLEFIGGPYYLMQLTHAVVSSANIITHCYKVKETAILRKLIGISGEVINQAYEDSGDFHDVLTYAEAALFEIFTDISSSKNISLDKISLNLQKKLFDVPEQHEDDYYTYTRMVEWDRINGPLFNGLYIIAARPAMGKTAFAVDMVCKMAKKYPVGFVNIEMTEEQIAQRCVSNLKKFHNDLFKKKASERTQEERDIIAQGLKEFTELQLHIDTDTTQIDRIINKLRFWKNKFGIRCAVIDYLGIISLAEDMSRYMPEVQALNYILKALRAAAKKIELPIILLCQLNRELYKRGGNKEPGLSDLKGSGMIEEAAFQISFLHRPEYYGITEEETGEPTAGLLYQIIAKHRDGALARIKYKFEGEYSKLDDWIGELGGWKPFQRDDKTEDKLYVVKGSKMKQDDLNFPDDDAPF